MGKKKLFEFNWKEGVVKTILSFILIVILGWTNTSINDGHAHMVQFGLSGNMFLLIIILSILFIIFSVKLKK